jgi:hypothetical protein
MIVRAVLLLVYHLAKSNCSCSSATTDDRLYFALIHVSLRLNVIKLRDKLALEYSMIG